MRKSNRIIVSSVLLCLLSSFSGFTEEKSDVLQKAIDTYIYGYPLVLMNATKNMMTHPSVLYVGPYAPINQLGHTREFVTPSFDVIVSPNVDTLYTTGWLDLTQEPLVFHTPDTKDRYYVVELLDDWTNVLASIGKRTTGTKEQNFVLVGPNWQGTLPENLPVIPCTTNNVWLIGRIFCKGPLEYKEVHSLQNKFTIQTLNSYLSPNTSTEKSSMITKYLKNLSPKKEVENMGAQEFYKTMLEMMSTNPPPKEDSMAVKNMERLGLTAGKNFDINKLPAPYKESLLSSVKEAQETISSSVKTMGHIVNGWQINIENMGNFGTHYLMRAVVAYVGLGSNLPEDAIYYYTQKDQDGLLLQGNSNYVIHFNKGDFPPVNAFWSITMYNSQHYLVKNPLDRYAIHFYDRLEYNKDGSLDIYVQNKEPDTKRNNWLPSPKEEFCLILRMYWPKKEALSGEWKPPFVRCEKKTD